MRQSSQVARSSAGDPMTPHPVMIRRIIWENDDTFTLTIDLSDEMEGYQFLPGQFNMVYMYGIGEAAISISSNPFRTGTLDHTIHRVGTVTTALAQKKRGDMIGLRGPYGSSWPIDIARGKDVCIVSGGIGLAPLRPVIYTLLAERAAYGRIIVLYGGRSPLDLLYRVELEKWANEHNIEVLVTVDRGDSSWKGHIGVVTALFSYIKLDAQATVAYVCGPEIMMKYTLNELDRRGLAPDQVYLSMERNMKCAIGICGHCQFGPTFICKEGPVYPLPRVRALLDRKEL
ncbi:MAG: Ni/Fe hydrogenase subunit gamma [Bacteroidetes bacterium]|nr:Ni/Fe hydrogenase subunit gamma [Bacteroidota bacterium]